MDNNEGWKRIRLLGQKLSDKEEALKTLQNENDALTDRNKYLLEHHRVGTNILKKEVEDVTRKAEAEKLAFESTNAELRKKLEAAEKELKEMKSELGKIEGIYSVPDDAGGNVKVENREVEVVERPMAPHVAGPIEIDLTESDDEYADDCIIADKVIVNERTVVPGQVKEDVDEDDDSDLDQFDEPLNIRQARCVKDLIGVKVERNEVSNNCEHQLPSTVATALSLTTHRTSGSRRSSTQDSVRRLGCIKCGETFPCGSKLRTHLLKKHNATMVGGNYTCGLCGKLCIDRGALIHHQRNAHPKTVHRRK